MRGDVDTIKERLNITEIVSGYIKLEKAGTSFKARCPFHNEKTPSFFVSPARQSFYCFGCGAKGDIFTFVEEMEGLDFRGALSLLAEKAGVGVKYCRGGIKKEKRSKKKIKAGRVGPPPPPPGGGGPPLYNFLNFFFFFFFYSPSAIFNLH